MYRSARPPLALLVLLAPALSIGCGASSMMSGDVGVTPGGSQDINYAREVIEGGGIPAADQFTAEGLFSQHDLPLDGPDCEEVLCPRTAATPFEPVDGSGPRMLVQLGFGTAVTAENFERRPLDLAVAVDISGSMSGDSKLEAVKAALSTMVDQLNEGDQLALVAFDDHASVRQPLTVMDEAGRRQMKDEIGRLHPGGGTDIEAGLSLAYGLLAPDAGAAGIEHRVMLLTDAQPNVGSTGVESFVGMTRYYGEAGIGVSVFGVGLDMGTELANAISHTRGGNYFFLQTRDDIEQVFDTEFDYMVSPIAYDLAVELTPVEGLQFAEGYGAPVDGDLHSVSLGASTLFLSARDGGIGATLVGDLPVSPGSKLADFSLSYTTLDGDVRTDEALVGYAGGTELGGQHVDADDEGVYKMAGLVDEYLALQAGATFCTGELDRVAAIGQIQAARDHLDAIATLLDNPLVRDEVALMEALQANVSARSPQCQSEDAYLY